MNFTVKRELYESLNTVYMAIYILTKRIALNVRNLSYTQSFKKKYTYTRIFLQGTINYSPQ